MRFWLVVAVLVVANGACWWWCWPSSATADGPGSQLPATTLAVTPVPADGREPDQPLHDRQSLLWLFDRPMQTAVTGAEVPGTISPPLAGVWLWESERALRFTPDEPWPLAQAFDVVLHRLRLQAVDGSRLASDQRQACSSATPTLEWVGSRAAGAGSAIGLRFSQPVAAARLWPLVTAATVDGRPLTLQAPKRGAAGDGAEQWFVVDLPEAYDDEQVQVTVAAGLVGLAGPLPTSSPVSRSLRLSRRPQFSAARCRSRSDGIELQFSRPVVATDLARLLSIDPPLPVRVDQRWSTAVRVRGDFEPGTAYRLTIAADDDPAQPLACSSTVLIPYDRCAVAILGGDGLMAAHGGRRLRLRLTNAGELTATVRRLDHEAIPAWQSQLGRRRPLGTARLLGRQVSERQVPIEPTLTSQEVDLAVAELLGEEAQPGTYLIDVEARAVRGGDSWRSRAQARCLIQLSEAAIVARVAPARVHCWVNGLADAAPLAGRPVQVTSDRARIVGRGLTDADGYASVPLELRHDEQPACILVETAGGGAWLDLESSRLDDAGCVTSGQEQLTSGYQAFCFAERGLVRPGEIIGLRAIVRDHRGAGPGGGLPLEWRWQRPDGQLWQVVPTTADAAGSVADQVQVPADAVPGTWTAALHLPGDERALGRYRCLVRSFLPLRMALTLTPPSLPAATWVPARDGDLLLGGQATWLHGGAVDDGRGTIDLQLHDRRFQPPGWAAWRFAHVDDPGVAVVDDGQPMACDAAGELRRRVPAALLRDHHQPLRITARLRVTPTGGRAESTVAVVDVLPAVAMPGLRQEPAEAGRLRWSAALVDALGQVAAGDETAALRLEAIDRSGYWRERQGRWRWQERVTATALVEEELRLLAGRATIDLPVPAGGEYRLTLALADGRRVDSTVWVGDGTRPPVDGDDPTGLPLQIALQAAPAGLPQARLTIDAPAAGRLVLTVEREDLLWQRSLPCAAGRQQIDLAIDPRWSPEVFIGATLVRAVDPAAAGPGTIHRYRALQRFRLPQDHRRLGVSLALPERIGAAEPVPVQAQVSDPAGRPLAGARVCLLVVDSGIARQDRQAPPDPLAWFAGPRRLAVAAHDPYDALLPEWLPDGASRVGGSDDLPLAAFLASAQMDLQNLAAASPWLISDDNGRVAWSCAHPTITAAAQVVAVVHAGDRYGLGRGELRLADDQRLLVTWPLHCDPADVIAVPLRLQRAAGSPAIDLRARLSGAVLGDDGRHWPLAGAEQLIAADDQSLLHLPLGLPALPMGCSGAVQLRVDLLDRQGAVLSSQERQLPLRPATPPRRERTALLVTADAAVALDPPASLVGDGLQLRVSLPADPQVLVQTDVALLLDYPYGCAEQTLSRILPLIALDALPAAARPAALGQDQLTERLAAGWRRLGLLRHADGLAMWPGGRSAWPWASVYGADMVVAAAAAGQPVPVAMRDHLLRACRDQLASDDLVTAAYAAWVLARQGRAIDQHLLAIAHALAADQELSDVARAECRALLALAWSALGQGRRGLAVIGPGSAALPSGSRVDGGRLSSPLRLAALETLAWLACQPDDPAILLRARLLQAALARGASTQERAWALRALAAVWQRWPPTGAAASLRLLAGERILATAGPGEDLTWSGPWRADLRLVADGRRVGDVVWQGRQSAVARIDQGCELRWLAALPERLTVGDAVVQTLELRSSRAVANLVAVWPFPAGCQVEAESPGGGAQLLMQDDRLVLVVPALAADRPLQLRLRIQSLMPVTTSWPAWRAELMYDPAIAGGTAPGPLRVDLAR